MIIDQKAMIPPPPPYLPPPPPFSEVAPKLKPKGQRTTLTTLPSHLLLQVVYSTFPQSDGQYEGEGKIERQRENLHWLVTSLRLVNRALYIASMHILRSTYIPAYDSLIRPPYSSDPFPSSVIETDTIIISTHREIATLDHFIALLAHEDLYLDATSLHLPREEAYKDLFDLAQPRSRLEDLVKEEGLNAGLIYLGEQPPLPPQPAEDDANRPVVDPAAVVPVQRFDLPEPKDTLQPAAPPSPIPSPTKTSFNPFSKTSYLALAKSKIRRDRSSSNTPPSPVTTPTSLVPYSSVDSKPKPSRINPIHFTSISISFSPRRVALVYTLPVAGNSGTAYPGADFGSLSMSVTGPTGPGGRTSKKTLVELARPREEKLEVTAKRIVRGLEDALLEDI
ncbi:hypothetical protein Moror_9470 [Moniliophthora roreri MCA 2997]|uniref:Uncharacterized protein n=2 Tax=Moniliophthora roreri TaxID=221103 RepID=V2Y2V6_MONRO|nr:hypothetical protein Moror_9470 [Moniliophthora roreri MCA 2997]KAI3613617.1 hypothetical protein WG66_006186 [Moniliophthora roreri]